MTAIDRKCKHCECIVDSHHEKKYNCLNLRCDCPAVDYQPPKKGTVSITPTNDKRPHAGFCDCQLCQDWYKKQWQGTWQ
jgi:hypothetical protein